MAALPTGGAIVVEVVRARAADTTAITLHVSDQAAWGGRYTKYRNR
ncbi:MAG: hypothetical protein ACRD0Y_09435 [Terriglobales bacterium]